MNSWCLPLLSGAFRLIPPGFPGKARLARAVFRRVAPKGEATLSTCWGDLLVPDLREPIGFHLLIDAVYEQDTVRFLERHLRPGGTFIDVGANIGVFTLVGSRAVGPHGRVLAIEASDVVFPYLEENVRRNRLSNVSLFACAAQDFDGINLEYYRAPPSHFGMGSLAPQFGAASVVVPGRTLDSLLTERSERIDVLKVDVEGFEARVFRGAASLLSGNKPPLLVFEFCDWAETRAGMKAGEAQRVILDAGYTLFRLRDYLLRRGSLSSPLTEGGEMLVGIPGGRRNEI